MIDFSISLLSLGAKQAALCRKDPETYYNCLVKFPSMRGTVFLVYGGLMAQKRITSLEKAPEDVKRYYWQESKSAAAGSLAKEKLIYLSKVFYALDYCLANL